MSREAAVFVDASDALATITERLLGSDRLPLRINRQPDITPDELPAALGGARIAVVDHTALPTAVARACDGLTDVVFLGTGARSYMDPEELAAHGITVHLIRGYGDTAVAEMAFALMWAAAKQLAAMDGAMRDGRWLRLEGMQLTGKTTTGKTTTGKTITGKTLGLVGLGGIGREMARLAVGTGMRVLAWNRTPRRQEGVTFVELDALLEASDVVSVHLLLDAETRGFLSAERIARMKKGAILVNTARGAILDEAALIEALRAGRLGHAALDVFDIEPLPPGHPLTTLDNVTLSAHSAFRTPEASDNLLAAAIDHCRRILGAAAGT